MPLVLLLGQPAARVTPSLEAAILDIFSRSCLLFERLGRVRDYFKMS